MGGPPAFEALVQVLVHGLGRMRVEHLFEAVPLARVSLNLVLVGDRLNE